MLEVNSPLIDAQSLSANLENDSLVLLDSSVEPVVVPGAAPSSELGENRVEESSRDIERSLKGFQKADPTNHLDYLRVRHKQLTATTTRT